MTLWASLGCFASHAVSSGIECTFMRFRLGMVMASIVWGGCFVAAPARLCCCFGQGLIHVGDQVFDIFDTDRQADDIGCSTCRRALFVGQLAVRG